ncbi:MAG TPA: hypothetical protein VM934_10540 [Pyrinomonadaceae bacterium]|jgi:hypothetical protein|nr:hypothetical protein [Pyrinomonadaceae bacterium]
MLKRVFKNIVFWSYGRTTLQYDVLCIAILAFVFLTPKSWFDGGELKPPELHHNVSLGAKKLLLLPPNPGQTPDAQEILKGARVATSRPEVRVKGWREVFDADGKIVAYEVDIE